MKKLFTTLILMTTLASAAEYLLDYQVVFGNIVSGKVHNQQVSLRPNGRLIICRLRDIRPDEKAYAADHFKGEDLHNLDMIKVMTIDSIGKLFVFYRDIDVRPVYKVIDSRGVRWMSKEQLSHPETTSGLQIVDQTNVNLPPKPKNLEKQEERLLECWHAVVYLVQGNDYVQGVLSFRDADWDSVFKDIWGDYHFAMPKQK